MRLFVIGFTAAILWIIQGILYHRWWTRGLSVTLSFDRSTAVEGENAFLSETITNAKYLPLPILHVKFQMGKHLIFTVSENSKITDQNYRSDIFSCMPWQQIRRNLEFTCKKRGYYAISGLQAVSYDLFFTSHFVEVLPVDASILVYPRPVAPLRLDLPLRSLMGQLLANRALLKDPFETQSIRPYQSFDPYRSVNWKATARTGDLKVNVYESTASWQVEFLLDVDSDLIWKDEDLTEESIRLCASYCCMLVEQGISTAVRTNGCDCLSGQPGYVNSGSGKDHSRWILEMLARLQIDALGHPSMEELLEQILKEKMYCSRGSEANTLYVLLSPRQHQSLMDAYTALCRLSPGSQWLVPMRPGSRLRITKPSDMDLYEWEVPYDRS